MKRAEAWALIGPWREQGMTGPEIATQTGLPYKLVRSVISDPDGSRQRRRRERYRGVCKTCGRKTSGCNGFQAPTECTRCHHARQSEERRWTPDAIIDAIRVFARDNGRPPIATEWMNATETTPSTRTVVGHMGWANAVEAAGFPRPVRGHNLYGNKKGGSNKGRQLVTTEMYIERLLSLSVDGAAPAYSSPNGDRAVLAIGAALQKRGISWDQACEMAGLRPRNKRSPKTTRPPRPGVLSVALLGASVRTST